MNNILCWIQYDDALFSADRYGLDKWRDIVRILGYVERLV
jgi:hypothetical protein